VHELIAKDPRNAERIFPYIGGEEVNNNPTYAHHRYVINFGEMTEEEARQWPDLMQIVEDKVRGIRASHSTAPWWQLERLRAKLYNAIQGMERVLVISLVTKYMGFAFLPAHLVFAHKLAVFPLSSYSAFCVLQSNVHEHWCQFFSSTLEDRLNYSPSDCFETFSFPKSFETNAALEQAGREYYEFRAQLMVANNEGLTKTYNRFHNPTERSPEIKKLRELHDAMDRAVLDAYGWTDLVPTCEFLLDYEEDEDDEDGSSRRKKPWRYRWPDDVRDEVLARLLELNKQRAEEEHLAGLTGAATAGTSQGRQKQSGHAAAQRKSRTPNMVQPNLLEM
jgi:restriction-modification enzyme MmeI-like protein